jgi:hypothetical protein
MEEKEVKETLEELPNWVKPIQKQMISEQKQAITLKRVIKRFKKQWHKPLSLWKPILNDEERGMIIL